jgi:hypothetical protein
MQESWKRTPCSFNTRVMAPMLKPATV